MPINDSKLELFTGINNDASGLEDLQRFFGFYDNVYRDPFIGGSAFIFVTKPMLFIDPNSPPIANSNEFTAYLNMTRDPFFTQFLANESLNKMDTEIVKSLSYKQDYTRSSFIPMFTNQCKSFDSTDITLEQTDSFDTKQGYKETLPTHKSASEASNSISISVTEDSNLSFTKLISLWVNYISNITDGTFSANPEMILNGTLDYMSSIYYFVLSPDGQTIKFWSKYTGCWPTAIPYSNLKYTKGSNEALELDIPFTYTIKEDMNPKILEEFNILSLKLQGQKIAPVPLNNLYAQIKESPLLNRNVMINVIPSANTILSSEEHDPFIFYVPGNSNSLNPDQTMPQFKLFFDKRGYSSELIESILQNDDYYINDKASDISEKGYSTDRWDKTDFWKSDEVIE